MAIKIEFNFSGSWEEHEAFITDLNTTEVLHKNLKPADSTAAAIMTPSVDLYNKLRGIVSASIPARIMDGAVTKFTGYLRNNFAIGKTQRLQPVRVELVTGSYLLKRKVQQTISYQGATVTQLVTNLLNLAGVVAYTLPTISKTIPAFSLIAGESGTYHEHIEALLFQYGYVGYFNLTGVFVTHKLDPATIVTGQVLDGSNCRFEIKQSKNETQTDRVEVHWHSTAQLSNAVVFSDVTNAKNGYSCFIELPAGTYLGGSEEWYAELDSPEGEILAVNDLSLKFNAELGVQVLKFQQEGKRALISIRNTTALTKAVRRLDIVAGTAIVKKDLNKAWVPLNPSPEKIEIFQANYIYDKASADNLANILGWYYRYSTFSYKVTSKTNYALGSLVVVTDTGIGTQTCLIVAKRTDLQTGEINYELDAIAEYSPAAAEAENTYTQPTPSPGPVANIINNDPPTNNVSGLALSSADNPNGTVDVTIAWNYAQGAVPADGFLVFFKRDINTPGDIDIFNTPNRYVPASDATAYTTTLNLPTRQSGAGTLAIHYRFGVIAFGNRSIGTVAHLAGVVEDPAWIDKTFASKLQFNGDNFWDLGTGEMRVGGANNYLRVNPAEEKVEFHGLDLELTESDLRTYSGSGDERHSLSHEETSLVWRNQAEDGDPNIEIGRIGYEAAHGKVIIDEIYGLVDGVPVPIKPLHPLPAYYGICENVLLAANEKLPFTTLYIDSNVFTWDTDNRRLYFNQAGLYRVGSRSSRFYVRTVFNADTYNGSNQLYFTISPSTPDTMAVHGEGMRYFNAGDYITLLNGQSEYKQTWLYVTKLEGATGGAGPIGPAGAQGETGPTGPAGANGVTVPDISGLATIDTIDAANDSLIIYDTSAGQHKKVAPEDIGGNPFNQNLNTTDSPAFAGLTVGGTAIFSPATRTDWATKGVIANVIGQLAWKNYGNNHTIFDASAGTTPNGGACDNTTPQVQWTGTYPTLMGWNGANTYGVRVNRADNGVFHIGTNMVDLPIGGFAICIGNISNAYLPAGGTFAWGRYRTGNASVDTATSGINAGGFQLSSGGSTNQIIFYQRLS